MDHRETELFMARMAEMQPRVPEWCKAERMEITVPQKKLWRYGTKDHRNMMNRTIKWVFSRVFGRQKRKEATL